MNVELKNQSLANKSNSLQLSKYSAPIDVSRSWIFLYKENKWMLGANITANRM